MRAPGYGSDMNGKSLWRYEVDVGGVIRAARMQQRRKRIDLKENEGTMTCKVYNRGAVPKEQADSEVVWLEGVTRTRQIVVEWIRGRSGNGNGRTEDDPDTDSPDTNGRLWTTTIDFIVQGIPQTASETLMENSDKRSLFTDESAGSVGKYYAIVSAMVIRRNPPSLHRVTTLSDPDLSGATYDRNAVPEESHSSLGRMEEGR
ncbi:hypothetical protein L210DRAFT_3507339 [Boletus edulis BED1]|uniref:Uncharacterized protein n=1 Tax=Boletus edulis BED1 TaxID=1328754 RepID=A0AAD4BK62_BOLED|nr:hypothetical protein L210DRAFT_3507339 [Boletus edulis BED1]